MHSTLKSFEKTARATANQFRTFVTTRVAAAKAARQPAFAQPTEMDILAQEAKAAAKARGFAAFQLKKERRKAAKRKGAIAAAALKTLH